MLSTELVKNQLSLHYQLPPAVAELVASYEEPRCVDLSRLATQALEALRQCHELTFSRLTELGPVSFVNERFMHSWGAQMEALLKNPNLQAADLLCMLSKSPTLMQCYTLKASPSRTVGEQTRRVLDVAIKYRKQFEPELAEICSWNEYLLFLALHQVGKGIAVADPSDPFGRRSLTFKEKEAGIVRRHMGETLQQLGVALKHIRLCEALLMHDTQALYLEGHISKNEALDRLYCHARQSEMAPHLFYKAVQIFHLTRVAATPLDFSSVVEIGQDQVAYGSKEKEMAKLIDQDIDSARKGEEVFYDLRRRLQTDSQSVIYKEVLSSLAQLTCFLEREHKTLLAHSYPVAREGQFREIHTGFCALFTLLLEEIRVSKPDDVARNYHDAVHPDHEVYVYDITPLTWLFPEDVVHTFAIHDFINQLMHFRRNYLCRFSLDAVQRIAVKLLEKDNAKDNKEIVFNPLLQRITFLHGTSSAILPSLLRTDLQLIPTGRLVKLGITPASGELGIGCSGTGVNLSSLSGTTLYHYYRPIRYATEYSFPVTVEVESGIVSKFLEKLRQLSKQNTSKSCCGLFNESRLFVWAQDANNESFSLRISLAVKRLRSLFPATFAPLRSSLETALTQLESDWAFFKTTDVYKEGMKHSETERGYFTRVEHCIAHLKEAFTAELSAELTLSPPSPFPLVLGSHSMHTNVYVGAYEVLSHGAVRLGRDLQFAFVRPEDREKMTSYLHQNDLAESVSVHTLDDLKAAGKAHAQSRNFFANILSYGPQKTAASQKPLSSPGGSAGAPAVSQI